VHDGDLRGVLFLPATREAATKERRPGVLVVGGSEGGVPTRRAGWLASHGYVALALGYFRYEDLPPLLEAIPLEYFGKALTWMLNRPEIDREKLAVMGTSRGGELALQLGSMYKVQAVVAFVPANALHPACCGGNFRPYAWTWQGQPLAFTFEGRGGGRQGDAMRAAIRVENTPGPILTISGQEDHIWNSAEMAEEVMARLKRNHFAYSFENLKYPHAGHLAGRTEIMPAWHGKGRHPVSGREEDFGGTPPGNAASSLDAIPKVLEFLKKSLGS
jgi:dienelactone hydrolase